MKHSSTKDLVDMACRIARIEERQISIASKLDDDISSTKSLLEEMTRRVTALEKLKSQLIIIATILSVGLSMLWDWLFFKITGHSRH